MKPLFYIERTTGKRETEKVFGETALKFIYGDDWISKFVGIPLLHILIKNPIFSALYGWWQKQAWSKKKVQPFVEAFSVDDSEFEKPIEKFSSFNDFFVRKLKKEARPIAAGKNVAVMPADGRYRFYPHLHQSEGFLVKGEKFDLETLLEDEELAKRYKNGTMVMARLCPSDYHRFHFPCDCIPGPSKVINGWLYSVNPVAVRKDIHIFTKNKRSLCELQSDVFGKILYIEVGATNVGSINQTYIPFQPYQKGDEKGYFSFGASALILLFEPERIALEPDLIAFSEQEYEIRCLLGQPLGRQKS